MTTLSYIVIIVQQARAEGGALGAQAPALFQNYPKVPLSDKLQ